MLELEKRLWQLCIKERRPLMSHCRKLTLVFRQLPVPGPFEVWYKMFWWGRCKKLRCHYCGHGLCSFCEVNGSVSVCGSLIKIAGCFLFVCMSVKPAYICVTAGSVWQQTEQTSTTTTTTTTTPIHGKSLVVVQQISSGHPSVFCCHNITAIVISSQSASHWPLCRTD